MFQRIISSNSSSVMTGMPSVRALPSLHPAASPATTYDVFLETEPDDALPPRASTAAARLVPRVALRERAGEHEGLAEQSGWSRRCSSRPSMLTPASRRRADVVLASAGSAPSDSATLRGGDGADVVHGSELLRRWHVSKGVQGAERGLPAPWPPSAPPAGYRTRTEGGKDPAACSFRSRL